MDNCDRLDLQDETRIGGDTHDLNGSARRPMIGAPVSVHHFLNDVLICGDVLDEFGDLDDIGDFPASGLHGWRRSPWKKKMAVRCAVGPAAVAEFEPICSAAEACATLVCASALLPGPWSTRGSRTLASHTSHT